MIRRALAGGRVAALAAGAVFLAGLLGCASGVRREWEARDLEAMGRVRDGDLLVLYPEDRPWGKPLAEEVLGILRAGREVAAEELGLGEAPFALALLEGSGSRAIELERRLFRDPERGGLVETYPLPVGGREEISPADSRHAALTLGVHEMGHVLLRSRTAPQPFHFWLNEGIAEWLAYRTGLRAAPESVGRFLREEIRRLDALPEEGSIDFLRWSPGRGEISVGSTLPSGEFGTFGWSDPRRLSQVRREVDRLESRLLEGAFSPEQAPDFESHLRMWKEWLAVAESAPLPGEAPLSSDRVPARWGVYALLLAYFLEIEQAGVEIDDWIASVSPPAAPGATPAAFDAVGGTPIRLTPPLRRTNREILAELERLGGRAIAPLARAYPVARARHVLEGALGRLSTAASQAPPHASQSIQRSFSSRAADIAPGISAGPGSPTYHWK